MTTKDNALDDLMSMFELEATPIQELDINERFMKHYCNDNGNRERLFAYTMKNYFSALKFITKECDASIVHRTIKDGVPSVETVPAEQIAKALAVMYLLSMYDYWFGAHLKNRADVDVCAKFVIGLPGIRKEILSFCEKDA